MRRHYSLFAGLLLLSAANAQTLPGPNDPPSAATASPLSLLPPIPPHKPAFRDLGRLPLAFESNQGQTDSHVRFLTHTADSTLFLTPSEAVFNMAAPTSRAFHTRSALRKDRKADRTAAKISQVALRMQMVGANPRATALREQALAGRINYFIGKEPSKWHVGVPTFGSVGFHGVYPGVDLVYYGNQRHLEYDFVVAPHADPKQIQLHFAGAQGVHLNAASDLIVRVQGRELTWQKPMVYQQDAQGKHAVAARFHLKKLPNGQANVSFALGRYDTGRTLVIDPVLLYSTFLGDDTRSPYQAAIAVDSLGYAYVTGPADSTSFPTTAGAYQTINHGQNAFVTKVNRTGTALVYSTFLGGAGDDNTVGIAVDNNAYAYIAGCTTSADFPTTPGAFRRQRVGSATCFVTKLSPTGNALVYSTSLGGGNNDLARAIAIDSSGDAFVGGTTLSSDFPTTTGAFQIHNRNTSGGSNAFVTKLNPLGTALIYSTYLGGTGRTGVAFDDLVMGIAVDSRGDAFVTGGTESYDFPTTPGAFQTVSPQPIGTSGRLSTFVTELNPGGTGLIYSTFLGGSGGRNESGAGIAIDGSGNAYVTGQTDSPDFPITPGAYQATTPSIFVSKLNSTGTALVYSTFLGVSDDFTETSTGIAIDSSGNAYITGQTDSASFPTTLGAFRRMRAPRYNVTGFLTKLNSTGTALLYSTYLGGAGGSASIEGDYPLALALGSSNNVYITGVTFSSDFPTTPGAFRTTNPVASGRTAAFVTRLSTLPVLPDFNNDGFVDLLLQNASTGAIISWFMNGSTFTGGAYYSLNPPLDYKLVGVGDFGGTGLGISTLVFQSSLTNKIIYWYTGGANDATVTGGDYVNLTPAPVWKLVGVGDFTGDSKSDLVLQNQTTSQVAIYFMSGPYYQGGVVLTDTPLTGWKVVGVGDFNGDGQTDIAFQNQSSGQIALWYMNGTTYSSGLLVQTLPAKGWKVVAVGDYNGDGIADLVFQSPTSNQGVVWYLSSTGSVLSASAQLSTHAPVGWNFAGPH